MPQHFPFTFPMKMERENKTANGPIEFNFIESSDSIFILSPTHISYLFFAPLLRQITKEFITKPNPHTFSHIYRIYYRSSNPILSISTNIILNKLLYIISTYSREYKLFFFFSSLAMRRFESRSAGR